MGKYVLEGKVLSESNVCEKVFIPRLSLTPSNIRIPFKFQSRQFSLVVSFTMTINNYFRMANCMLFFFRVTSIEGLKILITCEDGKYSKMTSNVVYEEVF
jgi:ATP-dependent DNA helicase PIF1